MDAERKKIQVKNDWRPRAFGFGAGVLALSALLAWIDGKGYWLQGWLAYSLMIGLGALIVWAAMRVTEPDFAARRAALTAAGIRLFVGVLLTLLMPAAGYQDVDTTLRGYVFDDANLRDYKAWEFAHSADSLAEAFTGKYPGDQYGGMMFLSTLIYRYLSPDAQRQILILALTAAAAGAGTLFLWRGVRNWFGEPVAIGSAWVFALYPEAVLLGSSQMRESFVMAAIAMAFYGLTHSTEGGRRWLLWLAGAAAVLLPLQPAGGLAAFVTLSGLWFFDPQRRRSWKQPLTWVGAFVLFAGAVFTVWSRLPSLQGAAPAEVLFQWLQYNTELQTETTVVDSGHAQEYLKTWAALIVYGVARPVLPGALVDPSVPIWRVINSLRSAGWYLMAPFLIYGTLRSLFAKERRAQIIWLSGMIWLWTLIASANGGVDMWDNPRYRTFFLAFQALLVVWGWRQAWLANDVWLPRALTVQAGWILLFTEWYVSRYYPEFHPEIFVHFSFPTMVLLSALIAVLILGSGWLYDFRKRRAQPSVGEAHRAE